MTDVPIVRGQRWRSKDRRGLGRVITIDYVTSADPFQVIAAHSGQRSTVLRADTLRRRYELITEDGTP